MADTVAFVVSATRSGNNIVLVLGDSIPSPTNRFLATFPIEDVTGSAAGTPVTIIQRALNGNS